MAKKLLERAQIATAAKEQRRACVAQAVEDNAGAVDVGADQGSAENTHQALAA